MIGRSSPMVKAIVKKLWFIKGLFGRPNEIFDTPRTVLSPSLFFTIETAFKVSIAAFCSADTVKVKQSMYKSRLGMPIDNARLSMELAISTRFSQVVGIPSSSKVRPTTDAPYFFTSGRIVIRDSSLPFTELTIGLPLYIRSAASSTAGSLESI